MSAAEIIEIYSMCILFLSSYYIILHSDRTVRMDRWYVALFLSVLLRILGDLLVQLTAGQAGSFFLGAHKAETFFIYAVSYFMLYAYAEYLSLFIGVRTPTGRRYTDLCAVVLGANALLLLISQFTGWMYRISDDNSYQRGVLFAVFPVSMGLLIAASMAFLLRYRSVLTKAEIVSFSAFEVLPVAAVVLQLRMGGIPLISMALALSSLMLFTNVQSGLHRSGQLLQQEVETQHKKNEQLIETLATVVEYRDLESGEHIRRMKNSCRILAQTMMQQCPQYQLTQEKVDLVVSASVLHDIGKIAIPDKVLLKPGRLTPEELEVMKAHSVKGAEIIRKMSALQDREYADTCYQIARSHHERFDGRGYPDGLIGNQIPIAAQIVSCIDVYDALVSKRVYKDAYSHEKACEMILDGECGAFNPDLMDCFLSVRDKLCVA